MKKRNGLAKLASGVLALIIIFTAMGGFTLNADEPENLLANYNPSFESDDGTTIPQWYAQESVALRSDTPHDGNYYISIPQKGSSSSKRIMSNATIGGISENTNYTLSFWYRSSVADSGCMEIRYYVGSTVYTTWGPNNPTEYIPGMGAITETFGVAASEPPEGETDLRFVWRKADINFTTPPHTTGLRILLYNVAANGDEYLCLDDFSLIATGKDTSNIIKNGELEYFEAEGVFSGWSMKNRTAPNTTYQIIEEEDGNHYFEATGKFYLQGTTIFYPGKYKVSFRFKNSNETQEPQIRFSGTNSFNTGYIGGASRVPAVGVANKWHTYTCYMDIPGPPTSGAGFTTSIFVPGDLCGGTYSIDDIAMVRDTGTTIEFGEGEIVNTEVTPRTYTNPSNGLVSNWTEAWTKIRPVTAISDATPVEGERIISANVHYVPEGTGTENFTLITAVYKCGDGTEELCDVALTSGETSDGRVRDLSNSVSVPEVEQGGAYTYKVRAFLWNTMTNIVPLRQVCELNY